MGHRDSIMPSRKTQAPSEKHLEDWLWAHPEALDQLYVKRFFKRQLSTTRGVIDLLGVSRDSEICIVELKKDAIGTRAFAQILRYVEGFQGIADEVLAEYAANRYRDYGRLPRDPAEHAVWDRTLIKPVLVGHSCDDQNLLIACKACNIDVYTYSRLGDGYTLKKDWRALSPLRDERRFSRQAPKEIRKTMLRRISQVLMDEHKTEVARGYFDFDAAEVAERYISGGDK